MRILGQEKAELLIEFFAAILFGFRPVHDEVRNALILLGAMKAGKSTVIKLLRRFIPDYALASISPSELVQRFLFGPVTRCSP